jgi:hypothetical protein
MKTKLFAAALLAASVGAQAAPIIADSATFTGDVITFNDFDGQVVSGSLPLGNGVTLTTPPNAIVGQYAQALGDNGLWSSIGNANRDGNFLSSAFTTNRGEIGFSFANPVSSVGAFVNQFQPEGVTNNRMLVVAYDINGFVLESFTLSVDTDASSYDEGKFVGFQRATADIYGFGFVDGTVVIDNVVTTAVPEPEALGLMLAGLGVAGLVARRRRA